jgi:hypothetical protein
MTETAAPYDIEPVLERVLAPFEKWADAGYAEGVVDFLPSLGRQPLLLSPASVSAVFGTAIFGIDPDGATEADKAEAARRFGFIERLMDELMTRERNIRDRYYASRNRGMVHRTLVMFAGMGILVAATVALPTWGSVTVGGLLACAGAAAYHRFNTKAKNLSIYIFEERAALIVGALPWMANVDRIAPRPLLGEA